MQICKKLNMYWLLQHSTSTMNIYFIHSLYVYFGNTVHIKIVQIMHRSCKLILKDNKKNKSTVLYTVY